MSFRGAAWTLACVGWALACGRLAGTENTNLAVVNVSKVFGNYKKVYDVQADVSGFFGPREKELESQFKKYKDLAEKIRQMRDQLDGANETLFDKVQELQKEEFLLRKAKQKLDEDKAKRMAEEMRNVLNEIRAAIRAVAELRNIQMVLRSPDTDDPLDDLAAPEPGKDANPNEEKVRAITKPRTTYELVNRVRRNPVLFGAKTVDITDDVLKTLNDDYADRSGKPQRK